MQYDIEGYGVDDDKIITKEGMPTLRTNLSDRPVPFLSTILILFYHGVVVGCSCFRLGSDFGYHSPPVDIRLE